MVAVPAVPTAGYLGLLALHCLYLGLLLPRLLLGLLLGLALLRLRLLLGLPLLHLLLLLRLTLGLLLLL